MNAKKYKKHKLSKEELEFYLKHKKSGHVHKDKTKVINRKRKYIEK